MLRSALVAVSLCLALSAPLWLTGACASDDFLLVGPQARPAQLDARGAAGSDLPPTALPAPTLRAEPAELLLNRYRKATVRGHGPRGSGEPWRLSARIEGGLDVNIDYGPPGGFRLPVRRGEAVFVRWYLEPDQASAGLVIRDSQGGLLAAVASGAGLPPGSLPDGIEVTDSGRTAYSEVRQLPDLCVVMIEHRLLRVRADADFHYVEPGTWASIRHEGVEYRLVALDASAASTDACPGRRPGHLSYALLAMRPTRTARPGPAP